MRRFKDSLLLRYSEATSRTHSTLFDLIIQIPGEKSSKTARNNHLPSQLPPGFTRDQNEARRFTTGTPS
jgi:hypothetical protein